MKVLLFTLEYPPFKGGVANYYEGLVKNWPSFTKNATDGKPEIFVLNNNKNKLIKKWLIPKWLFAFWHLYRTVKKEKIDHIIVGHILPLGTVVYLLNKFKKINYSVVFHGMDFTYTLNKKRKKKITKKILDRAENIICANNYTAGLVKNFLKEQKKVYVVNPGIDINIEFNKEKSNYLRKKYNLEDKIVLFSIGRLVKRKGFDTVLEVLSEAQKAVPNLFYIIAGDGPDKVYLKEKARGVNNVIFLGRIEDSDKFDWLAACDIFIMPSREIRLATTILQSGGQANGDHKNDDLATGDFEGFGIVYLEASLAQKPIIAGDTGGVKDAVKSGYSGILVDPKNKKRLAEVIIGFSQNEKLREDLGRQGRKRAINEFNWKRQVEKFYNIINKNI